MVSFLLRFFGELGSVVGQVLGMGLNGVFLLVCLFLFQVVMLILMVQNSMLNIISRNSMVRLVLMQVFSIMCCIWLIFLVGVSIWLVFSVVVYFLLRVMKLIVGLLLKILIRFVVVVQISNQVVGRMVIQIYCWCFILIRIMVVSISVMLVSIWLEMLNSGYRVLILFSGLIMFWYSSQFYSVMQLLVLMMLVVYDLVFFSVGMKLFSRFCSMKCLVWVLVFIVVRMNKVLKRIVKWYQKVMVFLFGSIWWRMCVIFIVRVGVLLVWVRMVVLLMFWVVWVSCFGVMVKFQLLMVVVIVLMLVLIIVGGLFMVKQMFGLIIEVVIIVMIVMKDFISMLLQLMQWVLGLWLSSFGVVFEEISVWKLDIVLQVMVMNRNGNRLFFQIGLVLLVNWVRVGIFSFGMMIRMLIVRLMMVLILRKVDRQLCGVSSSYIGSIEVMVLQLISIQVIWILLKVKCGVYFGLVVICLLSQIELSRRNILMIEILLIWLGWMKCMQMFMNSVMGMVVRMVNMFQGLLVRVFIMISVSIVRMMIMIRKVLNSVMVLVIWFIFLCISLFSEWLLWWLEMNRIMKFCIVLVRIMLVISQRVLGRQFICVVRIGLISGLVLVMVVKWWLKRMCLLVGMQFRLLLLSIVGVVWLGFSCIILLVMNRLQ